MLTFLFEVIGEFLIQVIGEVLFELGFHSLAEPFRRSPNLWLAPVGYFMIGAIAGGISLLIVSSHLVASNEWRIVNLVVTPVAVGLCMVAMGAWRAKRGQARCCASIVSRMGICSPWALQSSVSGSQNDG